MNKKRLALLRDLERIVAGQCYNGHIQNWGPNGTFEGEGRYFSYPLSIIGENGEKARAYYGQPLSPKVAMTGHYAFGANKLHIMNALDKVLDHLEQSHGLKL